MAIPNTTPTPNKLYNGEMIKMSDTELRVVLIVTRATLGWVVDKKTGMRKSEDWIAHSTLVKRTGRSGRAVSMAVDNCVKQGWIETRTKDGMLLKTAQARKAYGRRIYYRLGRIFLDKITTMEIDAMVKQPSQLTTPTIANNDIRPSQLLPCTKETLTKETLTKGKSLKNLQEKDLEIVSTKLITKPNGETVAHRIVRDKSRLIKKMSFPEL